MNERPIALLPELLLLGGAVGGLVLGLFLPRARQGLCFLTEMVSIVKTMPTRLPWRDYLQYPGSKKLSAAMTMVFETATL